MRKNLKIGDSRRNSIDPDQQYIYFIRSETLTSVTYFSKNQMKLLQIQAVLSQDTTLYYISLERFLKPQKTNEKDMLSKIWALKAHKNYLYGKAKVKIFIDHQPLTHSLSSRNGNARIMRCKPFLGEYDYEIFYKPGKNKKQYQNIKFKFQDFTMASNDVCTHTDNNQVDWKSLKDSHTLKRIPVSRTLKNIHSERRSSRM